MRTLVSCLGIALVSCLACSKASERAAPFAWPPWSEADLDRALPSPLPEVAATVNGQSITSRGAAILARRLMQTKAVDEKQKARAMRLALQSLVDRELLIQEALSRNLKADEKQLQQDYDQVRVNHKDDAAWRQFLAAEGLDEPTFLAEFRSQRLLRALAEAESGKLPPVTDRDARAYYEANPERFGTVEQVRVSQIFFAAPSGGPGAADPMPRVKAAVSRLRKGEDFRRVARELSDDKESAARGGEVPPFARGERPAEIEVAAFALKPGEVSDVITALDGLYIVKLEERIPAGSPAFARVEERARQLVLEQRIQQALAELLKTLRARARIEVFL